MKLFLLVAALVVAEVRSRDGNSHDDIIKLNENILKKENKQRGGISSFSASNEENEIQEGKLFEGDILMSKKLKTYIKSQRTGKTISLFDAIVNGAWPGTGGSTSRRILIPYTDNRLPYASRQAVAQAVAEYKAKTCIEFVKRTTQRSYIEFFVGGGCYSMIGRQGGKQQISLGRGCGVKGVTIHEMMHALGFFHEQSRRDRDRYIRINFGNIPSRVRYNFEKYRHGQANTLGEPYDKRSVMHYGNYAFSNNRQKTIVSLLNPNEVLGQRRGLSTIDVNQLNKYYKCNKGGVTTTKKPVTPKPTSCSDGYSLCPTLARVGLCSVKVSWVKNNCKKSCKGCTTTVPKPRCKGSSNSRYCADYYKKRYCTSGIWQTWMAQNCSQCGKCR